MLTPTRRRESFPPPPRFPILVSFWGLLYVWMHVLTDALIPDSPCAVSSRRTSRPSATRTSPYTCKQLGRHRRGKGPTGAVDPKEERHRDILITVPILNPNLEHSDVLSVVYTV